MSGALQIYRRINALSIDIVLGAISSMALAAWISGIHLPLMLWIGDALAVWFFYTSDHIIDSFWQSEFSLAVRHALHSKHTATLIGVGLAIGSGILCLSIFLFPWRVTLFGLALNGVILIYFGLVYWLRRQGKQLPKESFIAIIYTAGTWGVPFIYAARYPNLGEWCLLSSFVLLVQAEGLMAAWFDFRYDKREHHPSLAQLLGYRNAFWAVPLLLVVALCLTSIWLLLWSNTSNNLVVIGIWIAMSALIITPMCKPRYFRAEERFRLLGELAFIVPCVVAFWLLQ